MSDTKIVSVFGGYKMSEGDPIYGMAETTGRLLAKRGFAVMNGGYSGSMEAASRGARSANGHVIGVTCRILSSPPYNASPNTWLTETVDTEDLWQRIREMVERSHGFIALPGATGTLAEIAMAWELLCKRFMPLKPLVLFDFWKPLFDTLVTSPDLLSERAPRFRAAGGPGIRPDPSGIGRRRLSDT